MSKKNKKPLNTGKAIFAAASKHPAVTGVRVHGSHHIVETGLGSCSIPIHANDQMPTGTKKSVFRQLAVIGIVLAMVAVALVVSGIL